MSSNNIYGHIDGPLVIVGFGSIGRGFLPLIERHILFNRDSFHIIDPLPVSDTCNKVKGLQYHQIALNKQNYIEVLGGIFRKNKRGFCINLSVDTDSLDLMTFCRSIGVLYIDTVVEPWKGYYDEVKEDRSAQTNYALRQRVRDEKAANPGGTTAVSCCGANPGMVSWFVKEALLNLAGDFGLDRKTPTTRNDWAYLMRDIGIKGIHIAERDTQVATMAKPPNKFVNTWSVDGFLSESFQPAELGWGTHEVNFPDAAKKHSQGCLSAKKWLGKTAQCYNLMCSNQRNWMNYCRTIGTGMPMWSNRTVTVINLFAPFCRIRAITLLSLKLIGIFQRHSINQKATFFNERKLIHKGLMRASEINMMKPQWFAVVV